MLTLDVAISTYRPEGILRVEEMLKPLAPKKGVTYIVSWQEHAGTPVPEALSSRKDVEIHRFDIKGLSNNRNNAIDYCRGDIILIADDDLIYEEDFSVKIREVFKNEGSPDLATFKIKMPYSKTYPRENCDLLLPLPKNYYVSSVEIAFKREKIGNLRFWPELGLGAPEMNCGEEELFLISGIKRGLKCKFINTYIASHPAETTGDKITEGILKGQGFIVGVIYPFSSLLRIPLKALRLSKNGNISFFKAWSRLSLGRWKAISDWNKIPERYKW